MKNFGTIIDNFDAVTKQYVDDKASAKRIRGIKVDNATLADTAKKVQNAFTYKAHNKAEGTVLPITYDGNRAASLDFSANDFTYDYNSFNDIKIKLVDKGYASKTYVDNQDALKLDKAGGSITGNLTVGGNLTINGTTTTVDSTTLQVKDKLIEVAHGNTTTLTTPAGLVAPKYDGTNSGALVFDSTGTAYVGDVTLKDGNIDVANSGLQPLATRTGLVGGNLVQYDSSALTLKDSGKKISDFATSVKVNGNTIAPSGGVVDIGTVLTDASKFATAAQGSNADSALTKANANATEISNIKNGTTKVKSAEHADTADSATSAGTATKATEAMNVTENIKGHAIADIFETNGTTVKKATSAGTADKVANGLTLGGGVVYDGSKALSITAGNKMSITGGPGGVSIGLAHSVMPSTYNKVTVDGYGTVTAGENVDYLTSHQSIKKLNTNNTTAQTVNASEAIAGSGTINLHKVAKTGSYNDLSNKPTNYVTTDTAQDITGIKSFYQQTKFKNGIQIGDSNRIYGASDSPVVDQFLPAKDGTFAMTSDIPDVSGKLDKTTYEVNKTIDFGSSGVLYVGKFKVYDTNVTCEVTSTTNVTYSGKLVIATQNYAIAQMTVYGDAANTVAPNFFVKPSTTSNPYIEIYFKPSSWSKNVVHIYGSNIQAEPTDVCTNVPSVPSTATLKPKNALPTYSLSGTTLTITLP